MIGSAVERNGYVYIYNERGQQTGSMPAKRGLVGYTSSTVTVTDGNYNYIHDEKGHQTGTVSAR